MRDFIEIIERGNNRKILNPALAQVDGLTKMALARISANLRITQDDGPNETDKRSMPTPGKSYTRLLVVREVNRLIENDRYEDAMALLSAVDVGTIDHSSKKTRTGRKPRDRFDRSSRFDKLAA